MSRIEHVLRRLDAQLVLPEPARTRTLLEIGSDLRDAYASYRAAGLSEDAAAQRAAALLRVNDATARELRALHVRAYGVWVVRLAEAPRWERVSVTAIVLSAVAGGAYALRDLAVAPVSLWVVLLCAGVLLWTVIASLLAALNAGVSAELLQRRVAHVPMAALLLVVASCLIACVSLWHAATAGAAASDRAVISAVASAAELIALGLVLAVVGMLAWFHLYHRVAALRLLRAEWQVLVNEFQEAL